MTAPRISWSWCLFLLVAIAAVDVHAGMREKFDEQRAIKVKEIAQRFRIQENCCSAYREFQFKPLNRAHTRIQIGPNSPVYDFPTGRAKFEAFALPQLSRGDKLQLVLVERIPRDPSPAIRPMLILLSDHYEMISVFAPQAFDEGRIGLADEGKKATLLVDEMTSAARYAIVVADPRWVGKDMELEARAGIFMGPIPLSSSGPAFRKPYSYEGRTYLYLVKAR